MTQAGPAAPAGVPDQVEDEPRATPWLDEATLEIDFDFDRLSLGDIEDLEDLTGTAIRKLGAMLEATGEDMDIKVMRAIAWVSLRKRWPTMVYADTRDIPFTAFMPEAKGDAADPQ